MTEHTPTPWVYSNDTRFIYSTFLGGIAHEPEGSPLATRWPENAEFIVRACNSHADMLEALEWVTGTLEYLQGPNWQTIISARKAIAKAKGLADTPEEEK